MGAETKHKERTDDSTLHATAVGVYRTPLATPNANGDGEFDSGVWDRLDSEVWDRLLIDGVWPGGVTMTSEKARPGAGGGESSSQPVTLREYFDRGLDSLLARVMEQINSNDRRYLELFQAAKDATATAMVAAEKAIAAAMLSQEKAVSAALAAAEKAVGKAEESQLRVNVTQNEFRQQLKDQAATFVTIPEFHSTEGAFKTQVEAVRAGSEVSRAAIIDRVNILERARATVEGGRLTSKEDSEASKERQRRSILLVGIGLAVFQALLALVIFGFTRLTLK
jgi:hypothetical protein